MNPDHEYGRYMNSKIYLRKISHNCTSCFWLSALPPGIFVARHLRYLFVSGFVKNTLNTVIDISRITFKVLTFRVIVKEVLLKILPQIQRRQCWQKWTLFISYRDNFGPTPFCALEKNTRACHTRWHNLCSKFDYFDGRHGTNPITWKGIQLQSPTPIMAPGPHEYNYRKSLCFFFDVFLYIFRCSHFIQYSWQLW